jgi:hypothetical protein
VYEIGAVPDHVPGDAVSVSPSRAVPDTAGIAVFAGGAAATTAVAAEVAVFDPPAFVPVTTTRNVAPTSLPTRT